MNSRQLGLLNNEVSSSENVSTVNNLRINYVNQFLQSFYFMACACISNFLFNLHPIGSVSHLRDRTRKSLCAIPDYVIQTQCDQRMLRQIMLHRCSDVVHKARYVFLLDVVRINHFRVHNLQKSRDIFTDPIPDLNY